MFFLLPDTGSVCQCPLVGISLKEFEQMKNRVSGRGHKPAASPVFQSATTTTREVILGVDPSLRGTGFGVIRFGKPGPQAIAFGTIHAPTTWERSRCLARIAQTLRQVIQQHRPTICVIEGLFYAQNLQTALIMGEARGASLATVAEGGLEVYEIAPRKVKQAVVGYGAAQKLAVAKMVQRMLKLPELPDPDAADALALALAFSQEQNRFSFGGRKRI
jgi:crossover junction endodeoxyribonuclease RuvC